jgi:ABC-2 type transport system permease protein
VTFVRECFIVFRRQVRMNLRNPAWVLIGVMQPVLYLVLFGPLLKPLVDDFGVDNPYTFLVPGLLIQLGMFGAFFAGFGLIGEWREGVVEGERVTPASRTALLVGRLSRDVAQLFVQALTTKSEDVMAPVINMVMMPVLLLSGILLPMTIGPEWLQRVSDFMPFKWIVDSVRDTFTGDFGTSAMLWGTVWALGLFAVALWWGTSVFRKENA